jgi:uncharacterized protein (DUF1778 family)
MDKQRLSIRVDSERSEKLERAARQRQKTMTAWIEDWIDRLEEKPSFAAHL